MPSLKNLFTNGAKALTRLTASGDLRHASLLLGFEGRHEAPGKLPSSAIGPGAGAPAPYLDGLRRRAGAAHLFGLKHHAGASGKPSSGAAKPAAASTAHASPASKTALRAGRAEKSTSASRRGENHAGKVDRPASMTTWTAVKAAIAATLAQPERRAPTKPGSHPLVTMAQRIITAGEKARAPVPAPPAPPKGSVAAGILAAGEKARAPVPAPPAPPKGSVAARILAAGRKARGEG